ncbi:MAG: hypothetical protein ACKVOJ_11600 [Sphingomonadaceae bacterium]
MVDNFSLILAHGLLFLVAFRLYFRADLDVEDPPKTQAPPTQRFGKRG